MPPIVFTVIPAAWSAAGRPACRFSSLAKTAMVVSGWAWRSLATWLGALFPMVAIGTCTTRTEQLVQTLQLLLEPRGDLAGERELRDVVKGHLRTAAKLCSHVVGHQLALEARGGLSGLRVLDPVLLGPDHPGRHDRDIGLLELTQLVVPQLGTHPADDHRVRLGRNDAVESR